MTTKSNWFRFFVSTHSRTKAAASNICYYYRQLKVSTHSRAEAAAHICGQIHCRLPVSTHSRAEAAATINPYHSKRLNRFNTQPREGGCGWNWSAYRVKDTFQHTAARRRQLTSSWKGVLMLIVSTHSRAKAAAPIPFPAPEITGVFQHTAARRRLHILFQIWFNSLMFQHTAARRRLQHR